MSVSANGVQPSIFLETVNVLRDTDTTLWNPASLSLPSIPTRSPGSIVNVLLQLTVTTELA